MNKTDHEKILIIIALILCAGVIFYNAFFIPEVSTPAVVYVDKDLSSSESDAEISESDENYISSDGSVDSSGKVNINTATAQEISENLDGIGDTIAQRIVEYREQNGDFENIEEIKNVSGIGESKYENIKDAICV